LWDDVKEDVKSLFVLTGWAGREQTGLDSYHHHRERAPTGA